MSEELPEIKDPADPSGKTPPLSETQFQAMLSAAGEGSSVTSLATLYGKTVQYVSKALKNHGVTVGAVKRAREEKEKADAAGAAPKPAFAELRLSRIEDTQNQLFVFNKTMFQLGMKQAAQFARGEIVLTIKEQNSITRTNAIAAQELRRVLGMDTHIDEKELPVLQIQDLGEDEILDLQAGKIEGEEEDELIDLVDDEEPPEIVAEEP